MSGLVQSSFGFATGATLVAGVDEAGRGPLAGPVVAAAVILHPERPIPGLDDSKRLTEAARAELEPLIMSRCLSFGIGRAEVEEIDRLNILQATFLAMRRAVAALSPQPEQVLVDGNQCPSLPCPAQPVIGGDGLIEAISAASILAKQSRDREMVELALTFPDYGFERHKGYGTRAHLAALRAHGPSPVHRRSFRPVRDMLTPEGV